jgi:O-antigen ligase
MTTADGVVAARRGSWLALAAIVALIALALLASRTSLVLAAALFGGALVVSGYAAHRWPRGTLLAASIAVLIDPQILPMLLPADVTTGPIGMSEPLLAVSGLVVLIDAWRAGRVLDALRDPVLALTAGFVFLAIVSAILNATPPLVASLGIVMTVDAIAVYFAARMLPGIRHGGPIMIAGVVGACLAVALFGIAQVVVDPSLLGFGSFEGRFGEGERITSFIGNPNMVAAVIGIGLPFPLFASRHLEAPAHRWAARAVLFVLVLALLLTFSRGGWLAIGLGTLVGAAIVDWRCAGILAVTVILAWGAATVMPRGLAVGDGSAPPADVPDLIDSTADRIGNLGGEGDLRVRFIRDGLPIVTDHLLLGVGPGRYGGAVSSIFPSPIYDEYDTGLFRFRTVHNFWLHLLGESGALGTSVFLALMIGLMLRFVRGARQASGTLFVVLGGAATVVLVVSLNSVTEMVLEGNLPVILAWLVLGIASVFVPSRPVSAREANAGDSGNRD